MLILAIVFANAGISDNGAFALLAGAPLDGSPPPKPNLKVLDINLTAVTTTIYLALHYFRQNPTPGGKIVATASSAGLYALPYIPVYCASKHGVRRFPTDTFLRAFNELTFLGCWPDPISCSGI